MPIVLAQLFEPPLPGVAPVPWVEAWITGSGLLGAATLASLGALAVFIARRTPRARTVFAVGCGLIVSALGVLMIGQRTQTLREQLDAHTTRLVDAAATADTEVLTDLLHPDVRVRTRFGSGEGRARVIALSQQAAGFIQSHSIKRSAIDPRGSQVARTLITLRTEGTQLPRLSQWQLDWQRPTVDSPWVAVSIEPIWIQGIDNPAGQP